MKKRSAMPEITDEQLARWEAIEGCLSGIIVFSGIPESLREDSKKALQPITPPYAPLVSEEDLAHIDGRPGTSYPESIRMRTALTLRKAAARLDEGEYADDADARRLREWADQEEKCNA